MRKIIIHNWQVLSVLELLKTVKDLDKTSVKL
jgi:hypothetical protein